MAQSKLFYATSARVGEIAVKDGQIIFVPDIDTVYLDMQGTRFTYDIIHVFETDEERQAVPFPNSGFYFVESTHILGRGNNGAWAQITPKSLSPIMYGETEQDFPQIGEKDVLYYTDDGIYNGKEQSNQYNLIANVNTWKQM